MLTFVSSFSISIIIIHQYPFLLLSYSFGYNANNDVNKHFLQRTDVSGSSNIYNGDALVATSNNTVIVVTINYRLSIFGFLGGDVIAAQTSDKSQGNFGIQDQRLAMKWVKENIAAFGGDPSQITIFGESAGGNSVFNHLAMSNSFPYYNRAIIESGCYDEGAMQVKEANVNFNTVLKTFQCTDLACLKTKPAVNLLGVLMTLHRWGPVVDQIELTATPEQLFLQGKQHKVPTIIGSNRDELAFWTLKAVDSDCNETCFDIAITASFITSNRVFNASILQELKELYQFNGSYVYPKSLGTYSTYWWEETRVGTDAGTLDFFFQCWVIYSLCTCISCNYRKKYFLSVHSLV